MADRDPFGRLVGEDTLAGLGVPSDGIDHEAPEPVVAAEPASRARPAATPDRARRARSADAEEAQRKLAEYLRMSPAAQGADPAQIVRTVGRVVKAAFFVAVLVIIASIALVVFSAGDGVQDRFSELAEPSRIADEITKSLETVQENPGGTRAAGGTEPRGLAPGSLLVRRNLAPALRRLATSGLGRLKSMSIRPERIDAQLLTQGGRLRSVQLRHDGELRKLSLSGAGFAGLDTIAFSRLDPAAPSRLARSAAGRLKRPVSQVDYVVPIVVSGQLSWSVFMRDGRSFLGSAGGRITRRIG